MRWATNNAKGGAEEESVEEESEKLTGGGETTEEHKAKLRKSPADQPTAREVEESTWPPTSHTDPRARIAWRGQGGHPR